MSMLGGITRNVQVYGEIVRLSWQQETKHLKWEIVFWEEMSQQQKKAYKINKY